MDTNLHQSCEVTYQFLILIIFLTLLLLALLSAYRSHTYKHTKCHFKKNNIFNILVKDKDHSISVDEIRCCVRSLWVKILSENNELSEL